MTKRKETETDSPTEEATPEPRTRPTTFLRRMSMERAELAERVESLDRFLVGETFPTLDQEERERLQGQRTAMGHYLGILDARIAYHQARGVQ